MALGDNDLDVFLADGVEVTMGSETTMGQLDDVEDLVLEGEGARVASVGGTIGVLIATGSLPGLAVGSEITVDGQDLEVVFRRRIHEGHFTQLLCRPAP